MTRQPTPGVYDSYREPGEFGEGVTVRRAEPSKVSWLVSAIETIEKAMEGVTPGPWQTVQTGHGSRVKPDIAWCGHTSSQSHAETEANAAYIAACNPVAMCEVLALARQAEALQRENAELREALEPFAAIADQLPIRSVGVPDHRSVWGYDGVELSYGDFRRARALLGGENAGN